MTKFTTVFFDLNGVLILDKRGAVGSKIALKIFKRLLINDEKEKKAIEKEQNWSDADFWRFVDEEFTTVIPNVELIDLIKTLKEKGYKVGLITNTSGVIIRKTFQRFFGVSMEELFDTVVISSEVGLLKPDLKIFTLALESVNSKAKNAIFVDDCERYLQGARKLGMYTILYETNRQVLQELHFLFGAVNQKR